MCKPSFICWTPHGCSHWSPSTAARSKRATWCCLDSNCANLRYNNGIVWSFHGVHSVHTTCAEGVSVAAVAERWYLTLLNHHLQSCVQLCTHHSLRLLRTHRVNRYIHASVLSHCTVCQKTCCNTIVDKGWRQPMLIVMYMHSFTGKALLFYNSSLHCMGRASSSVDAHHTQECLNHLQSVTCLV